MTDLVYPFAPKTVVAMYLLEDLVDVISEYSLLGLPFTPREIRKTTHEFTEENDIDGFSEDKELVSSKWFSLFLKRYAQFCRSNKGLPTSLWPGLWAQPATSLKTGLTSTRGPGELSWA